VSTRPVFSTITPLPYACPTRTPTVALNKRSDSFRKWDYIAFSSPTPDGTPPANTAGTSTAAGDDDDEAGAVDEAFAAEAVAADAVAAEAVVDGAVADGASVAIRAAPPGAADGVCARLAGTPSVPITAAKATMPQACRIANAKPFAAKPFAAKPFAAKPFAAKPFAAKPFATRRIADERSAVEQFSTR
jgi:hypothetical protein